MEASSTAPSKLSLDAVRRRVSDPEDRDAKTVRFRGNNGAAEMAHFKSLGSPASNPEPLSPETVQMAEGTPEVVAGHTLPEECGDEVRESVQSVPLNATACNSTRSTATRTIFGIPEDCFHKILTYLPLKNLTTAAQVDRQLRRQASCNTLWRELCISDYGPDAELIMERHKEVVDPAHPTFYRELYRSMLRYEIELYFTTGPRANEVIRVKCSHQTAIGRSRQNDICILQDEMVSRKHGEIIFEGKRYWLRDLGSINGTFINTKQMTPEQGNVALTTEDEVEMGNSIFTIRLAAPRETEEDDASDIEAEICSNQDVAQDGMDVEGAPVYEGEGEGEDEDDEGRDHDDMDVEDGEEGDYFDEDHEQSEEF